MDKLPEELLCKIFKTLDPEQLYNLILMNNKYARIATKLLYSNCDLADFGPTKRLRKNRLFLCTLLTAPHLANLVDRIQAGKWQEDNPKVRNENVALVSLKDFC